LEYQINENGLLNLKRKILLDNIEFFSITSDLMKLIIHINSKNETDGNFGITHENSIQIVFCLANLIYTFTKLKKMLFVVPKSKMLVDKIKYISSIDKFKEMYNKYTNELFKTLGTTIPYDSEEVLLKLIPLSKLESRFTEVFCDKIILCTNKKIIELNSEFVDNAKLNIIPFNKLNKINLKSKNHKIILSLEDDSNYQYSTLYAKMIFDLIICYHKKECLSELKIIRN